MAHFTQLGLSGEPERKPKQEVRKISGTPHPESHNKFSGKQKTAATVCSLVAMSLLGVSLLETGGCSKASDKSTHISAPSPSAENAIMPPATEPQVNPVPLPVVAKKPIKKRVQRNLVASTYSNPAYGVTFRYLKPYALKEGDKANLEWAALAPAQMDFVQPGGTTLSAVELPGKMYGGTNFDSAFFNVSVNSKMTETECGQFAAPEANQTDATSTQEGTGATPAIPQAVEPAKGKMGSADFSEVENRSGEAEKQADAKYYHVFQNGACYEFALGLETKGEAAKGMKAVDTNEVFHRLNWMLSTVKIQSAGVPEPATQASGTVGGGKE